MKNVSGYDAARQVWESPVMQAANLSGGRWPGIPGSDAGTGAQAFSMMDHMAGRQGVVLVRNARVVKEFVGIQT